MDEVGLEFGEEQEYEEVESSDGEEDGEDLLEEAPLGAPQTKAPPPRPTLDPELELTEQQLPEGLIEEVTAELSGGSGGTEDVPADAHGPPPEGLVY